MAALELSPQSFFQTIHQDTKGIIALATIDFEADVKHRFQSQYGRYHTLNKTITEGTENLYFSLNTFKKFSRRTENLCELTSCYLDIDYYNTGYTKEQVMGNIDILIYDRDIPKPSLIVDSGRGLYLIWHLKRLPKEALPKWNIVQQYLYKQLKSFGADRRSLDAARIFRMDKSINTKNNKKVQVIAYHPIRYDLHQLYKKFIVEPDTYERKKKNNVTQKYHSLLYFHNHHSLYYKRLKDIARLCEIRDYNIQRHHCREIILFLYRYYSCCYVNDPEQALLDTLELNDLFKNPLPDQEVERATKSAERAYIERKYKYKNETLIEVLGIDPEEETFMETIISRREKYNRNNKKRKRDRRDLFGLNSRQEKKLQNIHTILDHRQQGYTQEITVEKTGLSLRTVKKYWNVKKEKKSMWYKILEGKQKGKIILVVEIIEEEGIAVLDNGKHIGLQFIAPLTKEEEARCLQVTEIDLEA